MSTGAPLPVREYMSVAEMQRHAAEVKARMFAPKPRLVVNNAEPVTSLSSVLIETDIIDPNEAMIRYDRWAEFVERTRETYGAAPQAERTRVMARDCFTAVVNVTGLPRDAIVGDRRIRTLVKARQILFWALHSRAQKSLLECGRMVGWRDHTTALHGFRRVVSIAQQSNLVLPEDLTASVKELWSAEWPDNWHRSGRKCS